jgi:hypothetical protein
VPFARGMHPIETDLIRSVKGNQDLPVVSISAQTAAELDTRNLSPNPDLDDPVPTVANPGPAYLIVDAVISLPISAVYCFRILNLTG